MKLTNYWWLIIWPFLFYGFALFLPHQREEIVLGKKCVRWNWLFAVLLAAPLVIWAGWRTDRFGDTAMYRRTFRNMPVGLLQMSEYLSRGRRGKGFVVFEYLFKSIISQSDIMFFFVIAFIQVFCLVCVYRKYSRNYWLSMFLFISSTDYILWMHNGMRQFIAAAIIFLSLPLLVKKKYLGMCLIVAAASLIHSSALIFLPFIFIVNGRAWNLRTILFLLGIILAVLFVDRVTGFIVNAMENTEYEGDIVYLNNPNGTNILRALFYSVPAIMTLVFRTRIDSANDPLINLCANLSIIAAGFYFFSVFTSGILMGSIPIYFSLTNYILIPWLITEIFDPASAVFIDTVFVGVYSYFFYYQMGATWGLL